MTRRVVSAAWQRASGWCVDPGLHRPYAPPVRHDGSAGPPETRWLRDSLRATQDELALFAITAAAVTARPAQFGATWARGERRALNPLAFMATAAALVTVTVTLASRLAPLGRPSSSLWGEALDSLGPYVYYVALGLVCHPVLRLWGSRHALAGSVAISLYAGGGPGTLATLVDLGLYLFIQRHFGKVSFSGPELLSPAVLSVGLFAMVVRVGSFVAFARALAGLHGLKTRGPLVALLVALVATGLVFGLLDPPGHYGMHIALGVLDHGRRLWWPVWVPL
jgi:hypothetical protein